MADDKYIKSSLHSLSPYIGKLRPEIACSLIDRYSKKNDVVYDPFCGSGTVLLEAWINNRVPVGTDLNYYAYVLSRAKLNPYSSLETALKKFNKYFFEVKNYGLANIPKAPDWVKDFFHPKTLKEILIWTELLKKKKEWFMLSCLMGILHHQRPGFLSYPCSHGAPYLRRDKYPQEKFPEMYEYRNVADRLLKKLNRAYKNLPDLDFSAIRTVYKRNTLAMKNATNSGMTIITSPPYMKSLTYARDNRLRLWFLGIPDWQELDRKVSTGKQDFLILMEKCFSLWKQQQKRGQYCILVVGDILYDKGSLKKLPDLMCVLGEQNQYEVVEIIDYPSNFDRKFEKKQSSIKTEKICVLRKK